MGDDYERIQRALRPDPVRRKPLLDVEPDWKDYWWGMPSFEQGDARPSRSLTVHFMSEVDFRAFCDRTGIPPNKRKDSAWFPYQKPLGNSVYYYDGPKTSSRYPVCIPSKGRWDCQTTGKILDRFGTSYKFFVEETEGDKYKEALGEGKVIVMPFHDLGKGSIPARNFIWEWAKERGYARHWVVDDNIKWFFRCHKNRRLIIRGGGIFVAMEDFVDRYENIALAGPHADKFVPDRNPKLTPILFNSRVYSCILVDTSLKVRWRGRYNEDTDLSLRTLKAGYCTVLFRALCMKKEDTVGAKDAKPMKGGNTDNVYVNGDHRLKFAESLAKQHPDCVKVVWKFNRWHHQVDYSAFRGNKPKLKPGIVPVPAPNEYGMAIVRRPDKRSDNDEA